MWEWLEKCDLWKDWRVRAQKSGHGFFLNVSACAVGWEAYKICKIVTIKKKWGLWTIHQSIASAFSSYQQDPSASSKTLADCSGVIAKNFAHYTMKFA